MCWIGKGPAKIAERDIIVYKLGYVIETTKEFRSLYQNYTYYPKGLNKVVTLVPVIFTTEVSKLQPSETGMIYEGYHSYKWIAFDDTNPRERCLYLGNYDNALKENLSLYGGYCCIGTFIIPKGTKYFENEHGHIVSSDIIYTGRYLKL